MFIKDFEFLDFFQSGLEDDLFEMAWGVGNVTKIPVVFNQDDIKYLENFPPKFWKDAIFWRYNEGLLKASTDFSKYLQNDHPGVASSGHIAFEKGDSPHIFKNIPHEMDVHHEKLGRPTHIRKKHPDDEHGIADLPEEILLDARDIPEDLYTNPDHKDLLNKFKHYWKEIYGDTPLPEDPKELTWDKFYKGGVVDADLSEPIRANVHALHDFEFENEKRKPEDIEAMKKQTMAKFKGMPAMRESAAKDNLSTWIKLNALAYLSKNNPAMGELNKHGVEANPYAIDLLGFNPAVKNLTYEGHPVDFIPLDSSATEMTKGVLGRGRALGFGFQNKAKGEASAIRGFDKLYLPAYAKEFNFHKLHKGEIKIKEGTYWVPIMQPGALFKRIVLNPEQEAQISKKKEGKEEETAGLDRMLKYWNLTTPEQREQLRNNRFSVAKLVKQQSDEDFEEKGFRKYNFWVGGGWDINKNIQKVHPLSQEEKEEHITDDVKIEIDKVASDAVRYYLKSLGTWQGALSDKAVYEALAPNMQTILYTRLLNLMGDPKHGIHAKNKEKALIRLKSKANEMTWAFSQFNISGLGTRRQRGKKTVSTNQGEVDLLELDAKARKIGGDAAEALFQRGKGVRLWFSRALHKSGEQLLSHHRLEHMLDTITNVDPNQVYKAKKALDNIEMVQIILRTTWEQLLHSTNQLVIQLAPNLNLENKTKVAQEWASEHYDDAVKANIENFDELAPEIEKFKKEQGIESPEKQKQVDPKDVAKFVNSITNSNNDKEEFEFEGQKYNLSQFKQAAFKGGVPAIVKLLHEIVGPGGMKTTWIMKLAEKAHAQLKDERGNIVNLTSPFQVQKDTVNNLLKSMGLHSIDMSQPPPVDLPLIGQAARQTVEKSQHQTDKIVIANEFAIEKMTPEEINQYVNAIATMPSEEFSKYKGFFQSILQNLEKEVGKQVAANSIPNKNTLTAWKALKQKFKI